MKYLIVLFAIYCFTPIYSYVPSLEFILNQAAFKHSHRPYKLEQTIAFQHITPPLIVKEEYTFLGSQKIELLIKFKLDGNDFIKKVIYQNNKKYIINADGSYHQSSTGDFWYMPLLTFNTSQQISQYLKNFKIINNQSFLEENKANTLVLDKIDQHVVFKVKLDDDGPQISIDQDNFVPRKLVLNDKIKINFSSYKHFDEKYWMPRIVEVHWEDAVIQTKVDSLTRLPANSFSLPTLRKPASDNNANLSDIFSDEVVKEFYKIFR